MEKAKRSKTLRSLLSIREEIPKKWYFFGVIITFLLFLVLWNVLSLLKLVDEVFLPTPINVVVTLFQSLVTADYWNQIGISVYRVFMEFIIACVIVILLGILAG